MYKKRKDHKGRVLQTGEYDINRNGRYMYMYKYVGLDKKPHYVYSPRLTGSDTMPEGARDKVALRDKIKEIQRDLNDGINPCGRNITVLNLVEEYVLQKNNVRDGTKKGYINVINRLKKCSFGNMDIGNVKTSYAKKWLRELQEKEDIGYSSISTIKGVLKPAFQMAVEDDLLRKNPFNFIITDVIKDDTKTVEAITLEQQQSLLDFIKNDKHFSKYYEAVYILFHTGLRISEFAGLTVKDIDFGNEYIIVNKQLLRKNGGNCKIEETKTKHGIRKIKMTKEVKQCFKTIIRRRNGNKIDPVIDGYYGFLYFNRKHTPLLAMHWEHYFKNICEKYNKEHKNEPLKVTPHVCRHTFATNMSRKGMPVEALKIIMGHSSSSVTSDYYIHLDNNYAAGEMLKYAGLIP